MSTHPRMASRVNVLERRQNTLEALIEELSEDTTTRFNQDARVGELSRDMTASFRQLVDYHIQTENQIDTRFKQVDTRFNLVTARFNQIDTRFDKVEKDIAEIKATMATKEDLAGMATKEDLKTEIAAVKNDMAAMATKEDLAALEHRILDAFKQLIVMVKP